MDRMAEQQVWRSVGGVGTTVRNVGSCNVRWCALYHTSNRDPCRCGAAASTSRRATAAWSWSTRPTRASSRRCSGTCRCGLESPLTSVFLRTVDGVSRLAGQCSSPGQALSCPVNSSQQPCQGSLARSTSCRWASCVAATQHRSWRCSLLPPCRHASRNADYRTKDQPDNS